jgi:hypothetical protein
VSKVVFSCTHCHKDFERYECQVPRRPFCSRECHTASRRVNERACPTCEAVFRPVHNGITYCSRQCAAQRLASVTPRALRSRLGKYRLKVDEYEALVERQMGICAICLQAPSDEQLLIDHDHRTGVVRGLLCRRCNTLLGQARDLPYVLENALQYLRERGCAEIHYLSAVVVDAS